MIALYYLYASQIQHMNMIHLYREQIYELDVK